jgi:hypothetical protein
MEIITLETQMEKWKELGYTHKWKNEKNYARNTNAKNWNNYARNTNRKMNEIKIERKSLGEWEIQIFRQLEF